MPLVSTYACRNEYATSRVVECSAGGFPRRTHNRLADPVLMLSPPGPLAERARAIPENALAWNLLRMYLWNVEYQSAFCVCKGGLSGCGLKVLGAAISAPRFHVARLGGNRLTAVARLTACHIRSHLRPIFLAGLPNLSTSPSRAPNKDEHPPATSTQHIID